MKESITIVGAGITGLAAACVLAEEYNVTIVARDMPGDMGTDWASPWAGAVFHPQKTTNPLHQKMQSQSFAFYYNIAQHDPKSGVRLYPMTEYFDDLSTDDTIWYKHLVQGYSIIPSEKLPENCTFGVKYKTLAMNPIFLLPWLKEKLVGKGVKFIRREIYSIAEARALTAGKAKMIINASGVGARTLARDDAVNPVRGQTMFIKTSFDELYMKEGSEYTYIIPRYGSDGVIVGGIKSARLDTEVDHDLKSDILERVNRITGDAFKDVDVRKVEDIVGFRPGRKGGLRVEKEGDVVHAYGVEGAGYIYSFGVAERVRELVKQSEVRARL